MRASVTRRSFLGTALAGGAAVGLGDLSFLGGLRPVSAAEAGLDPRVVRFDPAIEPLVRLLEETPRARLLEEVAARIHSGLSYRDVLAALLLAGIRNVQPRPSVGYKFHAVLVVNSAHIASLASAAEHRWLPIFWALDYFKSSQAQDVREGDWTMSAVDEKAVPPAERAREAFVRAMDGWDEAAGDAAAAGLARTAGAQQVFELLFRYGARDFRSIGHKAIYVANSFRTLAMIGWQHAEPVVRSLAYALLNHTGEENPSKSDLDADRPWRRNLELVRSVRKGWQGGKPDAAATADLLGVLRSGSDADASGKVVELLNRGVAPASIWDGLFHAAGELVMRKPGIVSLHAATTTNALRFAWETSGNDETRRLLMLQNAAFVTLFRDAAVRRGGELGGTTIDGIEPEAPSKSGAGAVEEVFAELGENRLGAARKALAYLGGGGRGEDLIDAARVLVFLKGDDAHDYKYSSAVLEDYHAVSPGLRDRFLAAGLFLLHGASEKENPLVERTRAALGAGRSKAF